MTNNNSLRTSQDVIIQTEKQYHSAVIKRALTEKRNRVKHEFLLTFFDKDNEYQEKEINGFFLIKQFRKETSQWEVAIYTSNAYYKKKRNQQRLRK